MRQKLVFPTGEIAHLWANQIQDEARNPGGNFYFEKNIIYSYGRHFPIAVHYKEKVLLTLDSYSNTTADHIRDVRDAISHKRVIKCLHPFSASQGNHSANLQYWIDQIKNQFPKLARATKPHIYTDEIARQTAEMNEYLQFFKDAKLSKEQKAVLKLSVSPELKEVAKKSAEKDFKAQKERNRKKKEADAKMIQYWQDNTAWEDMEAEVKQLAGSNRNWNGTYLRLHTDGKHIETSKSIKIPLNVAQRVYKQYLSKVQAGGCSGNCGDWKVLDYQVSEATAERFIIGCHNIERAEINRIAALLNW